MSKSLFSKLLELWRSRPTLSGQLREIWRLHKETRQINRDLVKELQNIVMTTRIQAELNKKLEEDIRKGMDELVRAGKFYAALQIGKDRKERVDMIKSLRPKAGRRRQPPKKQDSEPNSGAGEEEKSFTEMIKGELAAAGWNSPTGVGQTAVSGDKLKDEVIERVKGMIPMKNAGIFSGKLLEDLMRDSFSKIKVDEGASRISVLTDLAIGMAKDAGMEKKDVERYLDRISTPQTADEDRALKSMIDSRWSRKSQTPV